MATLKQRLHRKNVSGTYDVVHMETSADMVLMTDGKTKLSSKISAMDTTIAGKAASSHTHPAQTTITGNAGSATKLATARTIRTNLASTTAASFNGTANITPGVTGILPVANGGTGVTSLNALKTALGIGSPTVTAPTYPASIPAVGNTMSWAGKTWRVVHKLSGCAFLCLDAIEEYCSADPWFQCQTFANTLKIYACDYVIPLHDGVVWIPRHGQVFTSFDYWKTQANRIGKKNGTAVCWSVNNPIGTMGTLTYVGTNGAATASQAEKGSSVPALGLRPCVAIRL